MRILIADDQANVRSALRLLWFDRPHVRVLAMSSRPEAQMVEKEGSGKEQ